MKYRSIDSIARDICALQLGDAEGVRAGLVSRAIRNALTELQFHLSVSIKSEFMEISDALTIQMPAECIDVLKVGVWDASCGRFRIMGRDDMIRRGLDSTTSCSCDTTTPEASVCDSCGFHEVWHDGLWRGEMYGYRAKEFPNGMFRYNRGENRIEFGSGYDIAAGDSVLVEYRNALDGNDYALIPTEMTNLLSFRVLEILNTNTRPGVAQAQNRQFLASYKTLKRAYLNYSIEDMVGAIKGQSMSAPKF